MADADLGSNVPQIADNEIDDEVRIPLRRGSIAGWVYATTAQISGYVTEKIFGSFIGNAGKVPTVNDAGTALEFRTPGGLADAPSDGALYGRKDAAWAIAAAPAPSDGTVYGMKDGGWIAVTAGVPGGGTGGDPDVGGSTTQIRIYTRGTGAGLGWGYIAFLGADGQYIPAGAAIHRASSSQPGYGPDSAFDGDFLGGWLATTADADPWIEVEWPDPVSPTLIRLSPISGHPELAPDTFEFQYKNEDGDFLVGGNHAYEWPSDLPRNFPIAIVVGSSGGGGDPGDGGLPDPTTGEPGQVIVINEEGDGYEAVDFPKELPPLGFAGQVLAVNVDGTMLVYVDPPEGFPELGEPGQILIVNEEGDGIIWINPPGGLPPIVGQNGKFLKVVDGEVVWATFTGVEEAPENGVKYVRKNGEWVAESSPVFVAPYRVGGFFTTTPAANEVLFMHVSTDDFTLPAGLAGSRVSVGTNPASATALSLRKNGVEIATINIAVDGSKTFTMAAATEVIAGDVLSLVAPAAASNIANVAFTFRSS